MDPSIHEYVPHLSDDCELKGKHLHDVLDLLHVEIAKVSFHSKQQGAILQMHSAI